MAGAQRGEHHGDVTMAVRRRSLAERRVLALLRGNGEAPQGSRFSKLRGSAVACSLTIHPPDAPYLSGDELLLLGWLAQAQRIANASIAMPDDPALAAAIALRRRRAARRVQPSGLRRPD